MRSIQSLRDFYSDKTILVTGVHGFKGAWITALLQELGAQSITALGLPSQNRHLYDALNLPARGIDVREVDVRDHEGILQIFSEVQPDVVFHLAAQAIVSTGYSDPYLTFSSNTLGTVNILDGIRQLRKKVSSVIVTTDKSYFNAEKVEGYCEDDLLLGHDPYSASKSAAEHAIYSFSKCYFEPSLDNTIENFPKVVSPCRAGNVVGGGDFSVDRLIPDIVRALEADQSVSIRNFDATRPYEHVLDAVFAYVLLAAEQYDDFSKMGPYNVGPNDESIMDNREVIDYFANHAALKINDLSQATYHETTLLKLNSSKFREAFQWAPLWHDKQDILKHTFDWYEAYLSQRVNMGDFTNKQIREFLNG